MASKAHILEGVDFIETEEDAKAVEAATLKIQSTFRGKKIRSKLTTAKPQADENCSTNTTNTSETIEHQTELRQRQHETSQSTKELSKKVAAMQVNDNNQQKAPAASAAAAVGSGGASSSPPPVEEAERAATKIQAGFKGYKTRKELENKLGSGTGQAALAVGGEPAEPKRE